jgi:hypothetical protein
MKNIVYLVTMSGETRVKDEQKAFTSFEGATKFVESDTEWVKGSDLYMAVTVPASGEPEQSSTTFIFRKGDNDAAQVYGKYVITTVEVF